ncbi:hypothetical protein D1007_31514 [Hordeum vulgare]|nr:hypothetical protein D1007_31514 [Hordeum vulgare]
MTREPPHPARTHGVAVDSQGAVVIEAIAQLCSCGPTPKIGSQWHPRSSSSRTVLNDEQNVPHTPMAMTRDVDPNELQTQMVGEQYSQNMDDVFNRQHEVYGDRKMAMVIANLNDQENETQTPVSMSIDPKELRRQRDRERYAHNRDEILRRQRLSREKRKATTGLLNDVELIS